METDAIMLYASFLSFRQERTRRSDRGCRVVIRGERKLHIFVTSVKKDSVIAYQIRDMVGNVSPTMSHHARVHDFRLNDENDSLLNIYI